MNAENPSAGPDEIDRIQAQIDAAPAALHEAVRAALSMRYGKKNLKGGAILHRLKAVTQALTAKEPAAKEEFQTLAEYVGAVVLTDAIAGRTAFLEQLQGAIKEESAGMRVASHFAAAYLQAKLAVLQNKVSRMNAGEPTQDGDQNLPSMLEVTNEYLKMYPRAKRDSVEAQIKVWLKDSGNKVRHKNC